jgi:hypothetical protein
MKAATLLPLVLLAGCADPHQPLSADFGNSVATAVALQTINPLPPADGIADSDGQRLGAAIDRYRADRVHQPHLPFENGKLYSPPPIEPQSQVPQGK